MSMLNACVFWGNIILEMSINGPMQMARVTNVPGIPNMCALLESVIRMGAQQLVAQDSWGKAVNY